VLGRHEVESVGDDVSRVQMMMVVLVVLGTHLQSRLLESKVCKTGFGRRSRRSDEEVKEKGQAANGGARVSAGLVLPEGKKLFNDRKVSRPAASLVTSSHFILQYYCSFLNIILFIQ